MVLAEPKRIDDRSAKPGDIAVVARHKRHVVSRSGGGQQAVDDRYRPDRAHAPPTVGYRIIDAEHPTAERALDLAKPSFERRGFDRIA